MDYAKAFDYEGQNKLWKIIKDLRIQDHLSCLWRNQYAGKEAAIGTRHGTTDLGQKTKRKYRSS